MKRGRKPTVSLDEIRKVLINYKDQIIIKNTLIKPSSSLWQTLIEENNWNMNTKALWTRIHKFSPNVENFFYNNNKQVLSTVEDYDNSEISSNSSNSSSDDQSDKCNVYTISITADKWKIMQRDDEIRNKLKSGVWTNVLAEAIYEQEKLCCAWSFKSHEVPINDTSEYFFHFTATCTDTSCNTKMRGEVLKHKNLLDPLKHGLNITLYLTGNYSVHHTKKRRFGGIRRQEVSTRLLENCSSSSKCRRDLASQLSSNLFETESPLLPRLETIRKAKSEKRCESRHDFDVVLSLNIMQNCDPWQMIIRNLGMQPFFVLYWTPDQLRVYNAFNKNERAATITLDATGNVVKKIERTSGLSKYIFLYLIVIKLPNESEGQISVSQMLSETHNTNMICYWLLEWRRSGALPPKEIITDFSMALINAVCMAFAGCSEGSSSYIQNCMNFLMKCDGSKLPSCFIRVDIAHVLKFITRWKVLNESNIRRRVKEFYVRAIGQLAMATDLNEAKIIIKNIFIVMLAKDEGQLNNENVPSEDAKRFFVQRFSLGVQQSIVNSVMNLQVEENDDHNDHKYPGNNDNDQDDNGSNEIKNWISDILTSAKVLADTCGSRDNLMYVPKLLTPFKTLCYK